MRRAGLLVNPRAGRGLFAVVQAELVRVLAENGYEAEVRETSPDPEALQVLAREVGSRCDLLIACGGDGTVHGVLQGVAGTATPLGVLPLGTANALARNLGLPMEPAAALRKLLRYQPQGIPLGVAQTQAGDRWFTVMAGAGPDGSLVQAMQLAAKARRGRRAYYTEAGRLFVTRRFPVFQVAFRRCGSAVWERCSAVAMMASRVPDLGGLFTGLTRSSRLHHPHLQLQVVQAPAHLSLPAWIGMGRMGWERANPWLRRLAVEEVLCTALGEGRPVYAQVDGEAVGRLPLGLRVVPAGVWLMMPG